MTDWTEAFAKWVHIQAAASLNLQEIKILFDDLKQEGILPARLEFPPFVETAQKNGLIRVGTIKHVGKANPYRSEIVRYLINNPSVYSVALSLRSQSYLSHVSALFIHGVTEQNPQSIFVNKEQSPKSKNSSLTQAGIDRAFKGKGRRSQYIWSFDQSRFVLLNGKQTGDYGVEIEYLSDNESVRVTNIERTLVDIIVRPGYSGGPLEVLTAFKELKEKISVDKMLQTLQALDYTYPYHQSIGFAMERAGFDAESLSLFKQLGIKYDFYFDYHTKNPDYDLNWKLFYPKGL